MLATVFVMVSCWHPSQDVELVGSEPSLLSPSCFFVSLWISLSRLVNHLGRPHALWLNCCLQTSPQMDHLGHALDCSLHRCPLLVPVLSSVIKWLTGRCSPVYNHLTALWLTGNLHACQAAWGVSTVTMTFKSVVVFIFTAKHHGREHFPFYVIASGPVGEFGFTAIATHKTAF